MNKSYSELMSLKTFEERFDYLCDKHAVSDRTFGGYRWINQDFYSSYEWKKLIRPTIILRDNACDLAIPGRDIFFKYAFLVKRIKLYIMAISRL